MTMKRVNSFGLAFAAIVLLFVFLFLASRVGAQDATPLPSGDLPTTPNGVIALFTLFGGTLLVSGVTGVVKMFLPESVSAETIKQWVTVLAVFAYLGFGFSGHADWFGSGADVIGRIAPLVAGIIGALQGSSVAHQFSAKVGLPVFGYKRG